MEQAQTTTANDYQKQANDFLESTQTEFSVKFLRNGKHFDDDKDDRDIYEITLNVATVLIHSTLGKVLQNLPN